MPKSKPGAKRFKVQVSNGRVAVYHPLICEPLSIEENDCGRMLAAHDDLVAACRAVLRYDESILGRAARGEVDLLEKGGAVASGDDLDVLYNAMVDAARAALAKATGDSA